MGGKFPRGVGHILGPRMVTKGVIHVSNARCTKGGKNVGKGTRPQEVLQDQNGPKKYEKMCGREKCK